jgi:hypothetical protein
LAIDTLINRGDHPGLQAEEKKTLVAGAEIMKNPVTDELGKLVEKAADKIDEMQVAKKTAKQVKALIDNVEGTLGFATATG